MERKRTAANMREKRNRNTRLRMERLEHRTLLASDLVITEFVANNDQGLRDDDGDRQDWIELYNTGPETVNLDGYFLTDDALDLTKWRAPQKEIASNSFEIVFASGKDRIDPSNALHTSFRLSAAGESLLLVEPDGKTVVHSFVDFPTQHEDISFGHPQPIETLEALGRQSPVKYLIPTADNPGNVAQWTALHFEDSAWRDGIGSIGYDGFNILNDFIDTDIEEEMQDVNTSVYLRYEFQLDDISNFFSTNLNVRYDDGFVAYLNGVEVARRLAPDELTFDAKASDSRPSREKPEFDPVDTTQFADLLNVGDNVLAFHGLNRSSFLSFYLSPELTFLGPGEVSIEGNRYFDEPSPGTPNGEVAFLGVLDSVEVGLGRGFFDEPQDVSLASQNAGASIAYTLDGSTPSKSNGIIVAPADDESLAVTSVSITGTSMLRATIVRDDYISAAAETNTYVFLDDVITQSPEGEAPEGFPSGTVNGQVLNYGMDPDIVNHPEYGPLLRDALTDIPTVSLVTDLEHWFDPDTGIFVNADTARSETSLWERPASVELINPDGSEGFHIDAGVRIRGGNSRGDRNAKHAFRLFFRSEYGESKLRFPMFGDEGVNEFDNIDLRSPSLPSWHSCSLGHPRWGCKRSTFLRDVWGRDSQGDMGMPYTRSRYYHVYLNGQYWGLFQSQERPEASYAESYFGGDKLDYDVVKVEGIPRHVNATDGTVDTWRQLWEMAREGFESDAAYFRAQGLNPDGTPNPEYPVLLNVENLVDYMILQFYSGNWDGPISDNINNQEGNNWIGILDREGDTGYQFFAHDGEYMMFDVETNRLGPWTAGNTFQHSNPQWLHQQLVRNSRYRSYFGDRAYKHMFHDGALTEENARERFLDRMHEIKLAIIAESARWGDSNKRVPFNKNDWLAEVNWILEEFFPRRSEIVIDQFKNSPIGAATDLSAPILPSVDPPLFSQQGGDVVAGTEVSLNAGDDIYFTLDGSDPRASMPTVEFESLVRDGDAVRYHVPADASLEDLWFTKEFDDASWVEGTTSLGYERNVGQLEGAITTDLAEVMQGVNSSVYTRIPFGVSDPSAIEVLELSMKYDDGFVAYLNGTEVARSNVTDEVPSWDSRSITRRTGVDLLVFETVDLSEHLSLLRAGENVLAIQGTNGLANDGDFFLLPELHAGTIRNIGLSDSAQRYSAPFVIDEDSVVKARSIRGNQWSALNQVKFTVGRSPLRISEVMYHASAPTPSEVAAGFTDDDDFDFIELENAAETETLDLSGFTLSNAVDFVFPALELGPGQRVVVAGNAEAFRLRYGTDAEVAGQYGGGTRLNNAGELVRLANSLGFLIQEIAYSDAWFPNTDGDGFSLEALAQATVEELSTASGWHSSFVSGGSPGQSRIAPVDFSNDKLLGCADIDSLVAVIAEDSNFKSFDLTRDGLVGDADLDVWLTSAGTVNLPSQEAYLRGDVNLDGVVNALDLNLLRSNWLQGVNGWCSGDVHVDGVVDANDLNALGLSWLRDVALQAAFIAVRTPLAPLVHANRGMDDSEAISIPSIGSVDFDPPRIEKRNVLARRHTVPSTAAAGATSNENRLKLTDEVLKQWIGISQAKFK